MTNNLLNNNYNYLGALMPLKSTTLIKGYTQIVTAGDINLVYTCPAGKKAALMNWSFSSSLTPTVSCYINISAINYKIIQINTTQSQIYPIFLTAGQAFYFSSNQNATNLWANIIEFDSSIPISVNYTTSFINGNNTLYTCPANTIALPFSFCTMILTGYANNYVSPSCGIWNADASSTNLQWYVVPNGGSPGSTNVANGTTPSALTSATGTPPYGGGGNAVRPCCPIMTAGESIVVSSSIASTSILGFVYTYEVPV